MSNYLNNKLLNNMFPDRKRFNNIYNIGQKIPNKVINIDTYLIHNVSPSTNKLFFSRKTLAKKFGCKILTVNRALKLLKSYKGLKVNNNCLQYNYSYINQKGDVTND